MKPNTERSKATSLKMLANRVPSLSPDTTVSEAIEICEDSESDFFPVISGGEPLGLVQRDRIEALGQKHTRFGFKHGPRTGANHSVSELMAADALVLSEDIPIDSFFDHVFARKGCALNHDVILTRANGEYFGLITANTIFRHLYGFLGEHMRELRVQKEKLSFQHAQVLKVQQALKVTNENLAASRDKALEGAKMKDLFLANMSHEIRTPMNGVLGMISLLSETQLDADQSELLETAGNSAQALMRIINDILDFSKIEAGKMTIEHAPFSLKELIDSSVALFSEHASKKELEVNVTFDNVPEFVIGDPHRYNQIITNLLNNSIKFTDSGTIEIILANVMVGSRKGILTEVRDTGIGISKEKIDQLFAPFTQGDDSHARKYGGTGLGLSICRNLVELLGGTLECHSRPGEGSTFSFVLPFEHCKDSQPLLGADISDSYKANNISDEKENPSRFKDIRVLLVEDNPVNQNLARRMLERFKCPVTVAENGKIALEHLRSSTFDCIIMDCQMPVLDGYKTTEAIRAGEAGDQNKSIFIAAMTAQAMQSDRSRCRESGMDFYFSKPVGVKEFRRTMELCQKHIEANSSGLHA